MVARSQRLGGVPRHRAARVLAVDALEADLVAGEEHRHAGQGELQPGGDPVLLGRSRPAVRIRGGVVGAQDVPRRRWWPASRSRAVPLAHRARPSRRRRAAAPAAAGRTARAGEASVAQPRPDRPREAGVVHRAVPAVAVEVAGGVVVVLADAPARRAAGPARSRARCGPRRGRRRGAEPPGHVGHVDPPAVEVVRRSQPARHDAAGPRSCARRSPGSVWSSLGRVWWPIQHS